MKIRRVDIKRFKKFDELNRDLTDPDTGLSLDLVVIVGSNGSGKTSFLQAIACVLGTAVGRIKSPSALNWPPIFAWEHVGAGWRGYPEVELEVEFSDDEIAATGEYFQIWRTSRGIESAVPPANDKRVKVQLRGDTLTVLRGLARRYQFNGREYAQEAFRQRENAYEVFERVGSMFWYTDQRNSTTLTSDIENGKELALDYESLRQLLANLQPFHERVRTGQYILRPGQRDILSILETAYKSMFPGRRFDGPVPRSEVSDILKAPWFYLYDGRHQYEIAEMSGGERAIFPMLIDFANWSINNSVILIDEIELHLHPPMQQTLISTLKNLGKNNQFIVTTHSDWIADVVPATSIIRFD